MKRFVLGLLLSLVLLVPLVAYAISQWANGFDSMPTALAARNYMGVSNFWNYVRPGTNVTFRTVWPFMYIDAGTNGGGGACCTNGVDGTNGATGPQGIQGIQGPPGANGTNGLNGTNGVNAASGLVTNIFTTNLTSQVHTNAFVLDSFGRVTIGGNGVPTAALAPSSVSGPVRLSVYGDLALNDPYNSGTFFYSQHNNYGGGLAPSVILSNGVSGAGLYGGYVLVNSQPKQAAYVARTPTAFYSWGADYFNTGSHTFFLYDQTTTNDVFVVNATQQIGIRTNNPAYDLDVRGDINLTGTYRAGGVPGITTNVAIGGGLTLVISNGLAVGVR